MEKREHTEIWHSVRKTEAEMLFAHIFCRTEKEKEMNHYVTGTTIRRLRENKKLTQKELADTIGVSDKTVSKWETGRGLPDITLIEPLAKALQVSVMELLSGDCVTNLNRSANIRRSKIYVCPICGNIIRSIGNAVVSCCGIALPALEAEEPDEQHLIQAEVMDGEYHVFLNHPMTKDHYISFLAYVTDSSFELVKLYPEGSAEARFTARSWHGYIYAYCNRHGLVKIRL